MYWFPDSRNGYWRHWSSAEQISELDADILGDFRVEKGEVDDTCSPMSARCWSTRRAKLRSILRMWWNWRRLVVSCLSDASLFRVCRGVGAQRWGSWWVSWSWFSRPGSTRVGGPGQILKMKLSVATRMCTFRMWWNWRRLVVSSFWCFCT